MIRAASASPMPGSVFSWARLALLMSMSAGCARDLACVDVAPTVPWPADTPPARHNVATAISTRSLARICMIGYFACMTLMSAIRPVSWQTRQVSVVRQRGAARRVDRSRR